MTERDPKPESVLDLARRAGLETPDPDDFEFGGIDLNERGDEVIEAVLKTREADAVVGDG